MLQTVSLTWKVHISTEGFHNLLQLHLHRFSDYDMILSKRFLPLVDQSTDVTIYSIIPKMENWACVGDFWQLTAPCTYDIPHKQCKKMVCRYTSELKEIKITYIFFDFGACATSYNIMAAL